MEGMTKIFILNGQTCNKVVQQNSQNDRKTNGILKRTYGGEAGEAEQSFNIKELCISISYFGHDLSIDNVVYE